MYELPTEYENVLSENTPEQREDMLRNWLSSKLERIERMESRHEQALANFDERLKTVRSEMALYRSQTERQAEIIKSALQQLHGDAEQFDVADPALDSTWRKVLRVSCLIGFQDEAYRFARDMGLLGTWEAIEAGSIERDKEQAQHAIVNMVEDVHFADPRLTDVWKRSWRVAQENGFCGEFETIADKLGIPRPELTWSGTVDVRFGGTVTIAFSGIEADRDDILSHIDVQDEIEQAIRNGEADFEWDTEGYDVELED